MNSSRIIRPCRVCMQPSPCWAHDEIEIQQGNEVIKFPNLLAFVTRLANNQIEIAEQLRKVTETQNELVRQIQKAMLELSQESKADGH